MSYTKYVYWKAKLKKTPFGKKLVRLKKKYVQKYVRKKGKEKTEKERIKVKPPLLLGGVKSASTIGDLNKDYCTGCTACKNACPAKAITMVRNEQGFIESSLNNELCIHCSKCVRVCPVLTPNNKNKSDPACYAVMASDEIRRDSSSGGAFSLLAEHVLNKGGYVCGAAFDDDFSVHHVLIHDKVALPRLRRSKYVQSDVGEVFPQIKELLDHDEYVMFSGCPCQVAGIKAYLGKDYPKLLLTDIVCHGAPSQLVFDRYLEDNYGKENLERFEFRTKEYGYNSFHQIAYLKDGRKIAVDHPFDAYEKCMHSGISVKEICADCPFAPAPRQGDVTIGDFWGISSHRAELNDGLGTSVFLVNNPHGEAFFQEIQSSCKLAETVPFDVARTHNRFGSHMRVPGGREWLFGMMKTRPFNDALDYALNRKFDVGVVGLWYGVNYGSMATYFALHETLKRMGLSVLMIENALRPDGGDIFNSKTDPRHISDRFYDVSKKYPINKMRELNAFCDTFLVGSDQLWNVGLSRPYRQTYYLGFADDNKKKISVATSFGKPYAGTAEEQLISSHNLKRFDYVSVRDDLSKSICADWGIEAEVLCDPTLYFSAADYEPLVSLAELHEEEGYILAYILDPDEKTGDFLHALAQQEKRKVVVILDLNPKAWDKRRELLNLDRFRDVELKKNVDLPEWLWYYKHAAGVVTDSFHGTIFSVIYQKPFLTKVNQKRGAARFISLLTPLTLEGRMFDSFEEILNNSSLLKELNFTEANLHLTEIREHSLTWLRNALFAPKKVKSHGVYAIYGDASRDKLK